MIIDEYGAVGYTQQEVLDYLRVNPNFDIHGLLLTDGEQYIAAKEKTYIDIPDISLWADRVYDGSVVQYHLQLQKYWLIPEEASSFDIETYLKEKCSSESELNRVQIELDLYKKFNLLPLLRFLKYIRELADKANIVWGVGRGSSVASFCLYLLRIHKVNSLQFGLEITEFLRE